MRILIVAMSDSIHTARWINQFIDQGWDIHLFPSKDNGEVHPDITNVTVYHSFYGRDRNKDKSVKIRGFALFYKPIAVFAVKVLNRFMPQYRALGLKRLMKKIRPDIVHSMEIQHAGYLTMEAKRAHKESFPPWIVTNWGSDIYLFGRLAEHEPKIREVLAASDYYSCECKRDVALAREYGFNGEVLPVFPNAGGFDFERITSLRSSGKVADRKTIMLKGYQHWAGRALVGLRALERAAEILKGYEIVIYSVSSEVLIAAELFTKSTGIPTCIVAPQTPHEEILNLHGQARISIGLSISDAISTSLLEAMAMGSFPIQSWTSCGNEWIEDGKTGILVPPEDPEEVEKAIRRALTDDYLVDNAASLNSILVEDKLDQSNLKSKVVEFYKTVRDGKERRDHE